MQDLSKGCSDTYPLHGLYVFCNVAINSAISICDHDFEPAIEVTEPNADGWQGFTLQYHCFQPWDNSPWLIEDIDELVALLGIGISKANCDSFSAQNCSELLSFLKSAQESAQQVSMHKEWGGL